MDLHVYFVIFGFILMIVFISKIVNEISHARKNIISITHSLDDATEEILSLKQEIKLLKKSKY